MKVRDDIVLYDLTAAQALKPSVDAVAKRLNISKKDAKTIVLNSLVYNLVVNEIENHCAWMAGITDDLDNPI